MPPEKTIGQPYAGNPQVRMEWGCWKPGLEAAAPAFYQ
jgi:hypothetical protein